MKSFKTYIAEKSGEDVERSSVNDDDVYEYHPEKKTLKGKVGSPGSPLSQQVRTHRQMTRSSSMPSKDGYHYAQGMSIKHLGLKHE
jgi:hypothetical protein